MKVKYDIIGPAIATVVVIVMNASKILYYYRSSTRSHSGNQQGIIVR
jgi:hypothetical protein